MDTTAKSPDKVRHEKLVDTIRGVHEHLRRACQMGSEPDVVWLEHVKERLSREKYAQAMKELATTVWTNPDNSRITWCRSVWMWYFKDNGLSHWIHKFKQLYPEMVNDIELESRLLGLEQIQVLDVGSCYNPFRSFEECNCLALDLTPATECVYECDFLSLTIVDDSSSLETPKDGSRISHLNKESFHVVVFSLLLEYLPSSIQRWRCCVLACKLLTPLGLLLIVTPDSKSQHKNAPMIKAWKEAMKALGMHRIVYKKLPHLHCMAFSKVVKSEKCLDNIESSISDKMYIPQDTNDYTQCFNQQVTEERNEQLDSEIMQQFLELPFSEDDSE